MFSKSLDLEYRQFGISCHNQAPAYVATKMSKIRKPTMDAPSPANWVKAAIAHIGYEVTQCPFPCVPTSPWNLAPSKAATVIDTHLHSSGTENGSFTAVCATKLACGRVLPC